MIINKALLFWLVSIVIVLVFNAWFLGWKSTMPLAIIFTVFFLIDWLASNKKTTGMTSESKTKPMSDRRIFLDDHVIEYFWGMIYGLWDVLTGRYKIQVRSFLSSDSGDDHSAKFCKKYHISKRKQHKIFRESLKIISENLHRKKLGSNENSQVDDECLKS